MSLSDRMKNNLTAVILAAGSGTRMNLDVTKQRLIISGKSVISRTVDAFNSSDAVKAIIIVSRVDEIDLIRVEVSQYEKVVKIVAGGKTRAESAKIGFDASYNDGAEYIAIHDAARCFITAEMIATVANDAEKYEAATASTVLIDTLKEVDNDGFISSHKDRSLYRLMQTPQIFKKELYKKALAASDVTDSAITDDNMLMEKIGVKVFCSDTGKDNLKITVREDIALAEYLIESREK